MTPLLMTIFWYLRACMLKIIAKDVLGIPTKQQEKCLDDVAALPEKVLYDSQLDVAI